MLTIAQHVYQIAKDPANCGCTNGICSPNGGVNPNRVFLPPISKLDKTSLDWLDSYLSTAGISYPYADVAAFHGYVWSGYQPEHTVTDVHNLQLILAKHGLGQLPLWNTEASFEWDTNLSQDGHASWLLRYHTSQALLGISRFIWYAYDECAWGTLWASPLCTANSGAVNQLTEAGNAYITAQTWLVGANLAQCNQYANGLWVYELKRSGNYDAWMPWSSTGTAISVPLPTSFGLRYTVIQTTC